MEPSETPAPKPKVNPEYMSEEDMKYFDEALDAQSGGMIGQSDMSAKKMYTPRKKKKKVPQYYKGGGTIKAGKKYAYGGRVAKYKG